MSGVVAAVVTREAHWFHLFSFTHMVKPHNALWVLIVLFLYQMGAPLLKLISLHLKSWFTIIYPTCYTHTHMPLTCPLVAV